MPTTILLASLTLSRSATVLAVESLWLVEEAAFSSFPDFEQPANPATTQAVSYTHLTLPTKA